MVDHRPRFSDGHIVSEIGTSTHTLNSQRETLSINQPLTSETNTSDAEQRQILESISGVFKDFQNEDEDGDEEEIDDIDGDQEQRRNEVETQKRTTDLEDVKLALDKLRHMKSRYLVDGTREVADACRDVKWRKPVGKSGILSFFLEVLRDGKIDDKLKIQILRGLGNACADTNENRARVVESNSLRGIIELLLGTTLQPYALPVLHNICIDYEPAQKQVIDDHLIPKLVDLLSSSNMKTESLISYLPKLLDLLAGQESSQKSAPESTSFILLKYAASDTISDVEDFITFVTTATNYLATEQSQQYLVTELGLSTVLEVFEESYSRFTDLDEEDTQSLTQLRTVLIQKLADISDLQAFAPLLLSPSSSIAKTLRSWLSSPHLQLQICACITIGNIARNETTCILLVQDSKIHTQLITIIKSTNDSHLLHAAVGFLKNLALPLENKVLLGDVNLLEVLPRIWQKDVLQQVQFSSISLARQILINTPTNVERLLHSSSQNIDQESTTSSSPNNLTILTGLFAKTDIEPIKMEIARLLTSICRVLHSSDNITDLQRTRITFFENDEVLVKPLAFMVTQSKWPAIRSEAWFVFALTARSSEGANCISHVLLSDEVYTVLSNLVSDKTTLQVEETESSGVQVQNADKKDVMEESDTLLEELQGGEVVPEEGKGKQAEEMKRIDRMNVLVLLTEVLKNVGPVISIADRARLEGLINVGGKAIAT